MSKDIVKKVDEYYSKKIKDHGATSQGVDWNGKTSHFLRFEQLCKVFTDLNNPSLLDFGCGYGSLIDYLNSVNLHDYTYFGYDISAEMLKAANQKFSEEHIHFVDNLKTIDTVDYTIANGIFNVKLDRDDQEWEAYVKETLKEMDSKTKRGFSFNILTSFSDKDHKKEHLYYANPMLFFEYCKKNFSKNVALLHDYELYEFTIIVRKE
jgi:SAM-dependent methyltransferase